MYSDPMVLGTTPNNLTFQRKSEQNGKSEWAVNGTTYNSARLFSLSHEDAKSGRRRSVAKRTDRDPVTGLSGVVAEPSQFYFVLDRGPNKTEADVKAMIAQAVFLLTDAGFLTKFINGEA